MNQIEKHADTILNTPEYLADALIITAKQWELAGQQDEHLERVAGEYFLQLQRILQTDRDGVMDFLFRMEVAA